MITLYVILWLFFGVWGSYIGNRGIKRILDKTFPEYAPHKSGLVDYGFEAIMALFGPLNFMVTLVMYL